MLTISFGRGTCSIRQLLLGWARNVRGCFRRAKWLISDRWPGGVQAAGKTVLLIYDFSTQPFSVGDILTIQAASAAVARFRGCEIVDLAIVYSEDRPAIDAPDYRHIQSGEFFYHLTPIISVLLANPMLRSVYIFSTKEKLEKHIADNGNFYVVWPSVGAYASGEYLFYRCMNEIFVQHFDLYGEPPRLECSMPAMKWARQFIQDDYNKTFINISLQIRDNPNNTARNSVIIAWESLFTRLRALEINAKFFVVCSLKEIPNGWARFENVVLVKLQHTNLEQDLAVINACDCHMGASSGPAMVAILGRKPYRLYGYDGDESRLHCLVSEGGRQRFSFSAGNQYLVRRHEDADLLLADALELIDGLTLKDSR